LKTAQNPQRQVHALLPALGRGRRSRPTRKMPRCRKMLENAAESPASDARSVGLLFA